MSWCNVHECPDMVCGGPHRPDPGPQTIPLTVNPGPVVDQFIGAAEAEIRRVCARKTRELTHSLRLVIVALNIAVQNINSVEKLAELRAHLDAMAETLAVEDDRLSDL